MENAPAHSKSNSRFYRPFGHKIDAAGGSGASLSQSTRASRPEEGRRHGAQTKEANRRSPTQFTPGSAVSHAQSTRPRSPMRNRHEHSRAFASQVDLLRLELMKDQGAKGQ
jgi:hypothetical protein